MHLHTEYICEIKNNSHEELHEPPPPSPPFKYNFLNYLYLKDILHTVPCQLDISMSFQDPLLILEYAAGCLSVNVN